MDVFPNSHFVSLHSYLFLCSFCPEGISPLLYISRFINFTNKPLLVKNLMQNITLISLSLQRVIILDL